MSKVNVLVLRAPGTNCDYEMEHAFALAGAVPVSVHINRLLDGSINLFDYRVLAVPGGFSYGDDLGAGKIAANELRIGLGDKFCRFIEDGGLVFGVCNGFQILIKTGILPGPRMTSRPQVTLTNNDSGKFECRWINLKVDPAVNCVFTKGISRLNLPIAHGEGKIMCEETIASSLKAPLYYCDENGDITAPYPYNPNGSFKNMAGLTDNSGRVFALMPHPERYVVHSQHPSFTADHGKQPGEGFKIFENAVSWVKDL